MKKFEDAVAETMADANQNLRMAALDLRAVPQAIVDDFAAELPSERLQLVFFALLDALGMEEPALMQERYKRLELMGGLTPEEETFLVKALRNNPTRKVVDEVATIHQLKDYNRDPKKKEQVREIAEEEHKTKEDQS
ncbi:hypothetical protein AK812_SmicGene34176 [Symbiodinium microadriaticum]|uniref:Uncharacterized protein n=1 Tax=Symbiodinium microadriaticum TaxID=2951 RepID=A0A1Q9CPP1_SYMMI|nr:hypothetical protein AK812_SmicGene34176 [Symbiodinium microadriaticum]